MSARRVKCECGCGQAPAVSCRQRLVECTCGLKVRMTREWLERVTLQCSCGSTLEPVCLLDRAQSGDDAAWAEIEGRRAFSGLQSDRAKRGAAKRRARAAIAGLSSDDLADRIVAAGNSAAMAVLSPGAVRAAQIRTAGDDLPF